MTPYQYFKIDFKNKKCIKGYTIYNKTDYLLQPTVSHILQQYLFF